MGESAIEMIPTCLSSEYSSLDHHIFRSVLTEQGIYTIITIAISALFVADVKIEVCVYSLARYLRGCIQLRDSPLLASWCGESYFLLVQRTESTSSYKYSEKEN